MFLTKSRCSFDMGTPVKLTFRNAFLMSLSVASLNS